MWPGSGLTLPPWTFLPRYLSAGHFQHACAQPLLDEPYARGLPRGARRTSPTILDPGCRRSFGCPHRATSSPLGLDRHRQRVQGIVRAAFGRNPYEKPRKVLFVDGVEHLDDGAMTDLSSSAGTPRRPCARPPSDVRPRTGWLGTLPVGAARSYVRMFGSTARRSAPRLSVDSRRRLSLERVVCRAQSVDGIGVVQERGEPHLFSRLAASVLGRARWAHLPALRPERVTLNRFPLATSLPSTTSAAGPPALFGSFPGTMEVSDFPSPCIIGVRPWTFRCGLGANPSQTVAGSPGSRAKCFRACQGLRPRQVRLPLAMARPPVLPSAFLYSVGTQK